MSEPINTKLVELALRDANGIDFEAFFKAFAVALYGPNFLPIGGMHDGGADGALVTGIYEDTSKSGFYFQASVTEDVKKKIKSTVSSLLKSRGAIKRRGLSRCPS